MTNRKKERRENTQTKHTQKKTNNNNNNNNERQKRHGKEMMLNRKAKVTYRQRKDRHARLKKMINFQSCEIAPSHTITTI